MEIYVYGWIRKIGTILNMSFCKTYSKLLQHTLANSLKTIERLYRTCNYGMCSFIKKLWLLTANFLSGISTFAPFWLMLRDHQVVGKKSKVIGLEDFVVKITIYYV